MTNLTIIQTPDTIGFKLTDPDIESTFKVQPPDQPHLQAIKHTILMDLLEALGIRDWLDPNASQPVYYSAPTKYYNERGEEISEDDFAALHPELFK